MGEWQPIETAPKGGIRVDLWFCLAKTNQAARWPNCEWSERGQRWFGGPTDQNDESWVATHWQPLPAPPAAQRDMEAVR